MEEVELEKKSKELKARLKFHSFISEMEDSIKIKKIRENLNGK